MTRAQVVIVTGVSVYLLGMAFACGMAVERIRFDQRRTAVLDRYNETLREWHEFRMLTERQAMRYPSDGTGEQEAR